MIFAYCVIDFIKKHKLNERVACNIGIELIKIVIPTDIEKNYYNSVLTKVLKCF